jgi:recombination protein RecA
MMPATLEAVLSEFSTLVTPASRLERPAAPTVPCGIAAVDELTGGLPRGCLTEICGPASSGRTSLMMSALAEATARGEVCALVDASDCFDPLSAEQAGVDLERLLWVRCQARATSHGANPPQRHRDTEQNFEFRISNCESKPAANREQRDRHTHGLSEKAASGEQAAVKRKKEKEMCFINSGMKNCGSKGVHTQIYSGMPQIPEVNVLTRPEQRYRDISKLKQGDYREVWQSDQAATGNDLPEKIPPQRHRDTEENFEFRISNFDSTKPGTFRRGPARVGADFKSEFRNQKSEFASGDWLFHGRTSSPAMRAQFSRIEQALKVTDLLLQSGGFGLIVLDLGNVSTRAARRVPLTSWFRFRRAVENTPTVLLVLEREAHARSCAALVVQLSAISTQQSAKANHGFTRIDTDKSEGAVRRRSMQMDADEDTKHPPQRHRDTEGNFEFRVPSHAELLTRIDSCAEIARGERKGVASVRAEFASESAAQF